MIEDEIKALRCTIEELSSQYISATNKFADAVNHLSELMTTPMVEHKAASAVEKHGTDLPPKEESKPKEKAKPKKKKAKAPAKKEAPKAAEEGPTLTHVDVKAKLVKCIQNSGVADVTEAMADIVGSGASLEEVPDNDERLHKLVAFADKFLAAAE